MTAEVPEPLIIARHEGRLARITLNRPRAINALNTEMFIGIGRALSDVQSESAGVDAVLFDGAGDRGFCGGGDVKEIAAGGARAVFKLEYTLDHATHVSSVPIVGFMDGITMGGGLGLTGHIAHRVVTERSRIAMPEVRIGIVPDIGGHLLLARAPGRLGEYLAVTAGEMNGADAIALGFADAYVPSARLDELREALTRGGDPGETISRFAEAPPESTMLAVREWFDPIANSVLGAPGDTAVFDDPAAAAARLVRALEASEHEAARETASVVRAMCPLSVAVTLNQLARTRAENLDLAAVLEDDYRIVSRLAELPNFAEGVRAQVIDKDRSPKWIPASIEQLDPNEVREVLAPYGPNEQPLGL